MSFVKMIAILLGLLLAGGASARGIECPSGEDYSRLGDLRDQILLAETTEAAQDLALEQTRLGHRAISRAAKVLPNDPGLSNSAAALTAFEDGVRSADSPLGVASQVDQLMATGMGGCDYTNTEIVIIIIGFILGILPGILFLFLFC